MQGLILAAGVARRLYPITEKIPKCLIDIGGKPILSHQLDALGQYNVNEITIVLGYFKEMIVNYIIDNYPDMDFTFITNEHFFETNTSYSVYLCTEKLISAETVLMNGDVLYPPALLKRIAGNALVPTTSIVPVLFIVRAPVKLSSPNIAMEPRCLPV